MQFLYCLRVLFYFMNFLCVDVWKSLCSLARLWCWFCISNGHMKSTCVHMFCQDQRFPLFCQVYSEPSLLTVMSRSKLPKSSKPLKAILGSGWFKQKVVYFIFIFSFCVTHTKKLVWLCICIQFLFLVKKKRFEYKKWIQLFSVFIFLQINTLTFSFSFFISNL